MSEGYCAGDSTKFILAIYPVNIFNCSYQCNCRGSVSQLFPLSIFRIAAEKEQEVIMAESSEMTPPSSDRSSRNSSGSPAPEHGRGKLMEEKMRTCGVAACQWLGHILTQDEWTQFELQVVMDLRKCGVAARQLAGE